MKLMGLSASSGISLGHAVILEKANYHVADEEAMNPEGEIDLFHHAHQLAIKEVEDLYVKALNHLGETEAEIFTSHKMMLEDEEFIESVEEQIRDLHYQAPKAVKEVESLYVEMFSQMESDYLRERVIDIQDICQRLMNHLINGEGRRLEAIKKGAIIVATDLTPSDTMLLDKDQLGGFITEKGGQTSHTAIIARTLGIPAVVGVSGALQHIKNDMAVIVDGEQGYVQLEPDQEAIKKYETKKHEDMKRNEAYQGLKGKKTKSLDGYQARLSANIGDLEDIQKVLDADAKDVGLLRTEFIYMKAAQEPTEEEQFRVYKQIVEGLKGHHITIRTLDIGGDKGLPYFKIEKEENPFLGYRGIRYCLEHPRFFKTQLKAILRANQFGSIKVMFPMITRLEELRQAKALLNEAKEELTVAGISFKMPSAIGMMIETPASVVLAEQFAKEVDFFSIGTNDLIQYINVADRMNPKVSELYKIRYPAVLRCIKKVVEAANMQGIPVSMCGEAACEANLIPVWLKLGIGQLSMSTSQILKTRAYINKLKVNNMNEEMLWKSGTLKEIEAILNA